MQASWNSARLNPLHISPSFAVGAGPAHAPTGGEPLVKPVVAVAGDEVEMSARGICVNGRILPNTAPLQRDSNGRPLAPWRFGRYMVVPGMMWVASSYDSRSFDSRYFGPVPVSAIRDRLRPLLTTD